MGFLTSIIARLGTLYFQLQNDPLNHEGIHVHSLPGGQNSIAELLTYVPEAV